jgi:hypothetical protein
MAKGITWTNLISLDPRAWLKTSVSQSCRRAGTPSCRLDASGWWLQKRGIRPDRDRLRGAWRKSIGFQRSPEHPWLFRRCGNNCIRSNNVFHMFAINRIFHRLLFALTLGHFFHQSEPNSARNMAWTRYSGSDSPSDKPAPPKRKTPPGSRRAKRGNQGNPQTIAARYIDKRKFKELLHKKFGSHYQVQVSATRLSGLLLTNIPALKLTDALKHVLPVRSGETYGWRY